MGENVSDPIDLYITKENLLQVYSFGITTIQCTKMEISYKDISRSSYCSKKHFIDIKFFIIRKLHLVMNMLLIGFVQEFRHHHQHLRFYLMKNESMIKILIDLKYQMK